VQERSPLARAARSLCALCIATAVSALDSDPRAPAVRAALAPPAHATACTGARPPLPPVLFAHLRTAAFPDDPFPSVAVHVPPGFDAAYRPGLVLYIHGWQGCVAAALAQGDTRCDDGGEPRAASNLAMQIDGAHVNALLVAFELRRNAATGEVGGLAMPGQARSALRELFTEALAAPLGCVLDVDALDRIVLITHSGGYQAAASVLAYGDLPLVGEVVLLDSLYGAEPVFARWIAGDVDRFDPRLAAPLRFVDLYTCCGGTADTSRAFANSTAEVLARAGLPSSIRVDDAGGELDPAMLEAPVVFKRVSRAHSELPRAYVQDVVRAAGFAPIP
jgi:hypothetical protein